MQKRRRNGFALPAGRSLFRYENAFSLGAAQTGTKWTGQENNGQLPERQSTSKNIEPCTKTTPNSKENWPRRKGESVAGIGPHARRKTSFQLANFASRTHNFLQQDTETHQAVVLGSPGVGKTVLLVGSYRMIGQDVADQLRTLLALQKYQRPAVQLYKALIVRYVTGRFVHEYDPTLEMTYEKQQDIGNVKGTFRIMDTAGSIESCYSYIRKAEGIIVVYAITDRYSFETAKDYLLMIKEYTRHRSPFDYELPAILVGNKRELRRGREVSRDEARRTAEECGCLFVESSAAYDRNVQKIFTNLFLQIHRIKEERQRTISGNTSGFVNSVRNFFNSKKK